MRLTNNSVSSLSSHHSLSPKRRAPTSIMLWSCLEVEKSANYCRRTRVIISRHDLLIAPDCPKPGVMLDGEVCLLGSRRLFEKSFGRKRCVSCRDVVLGGIGGLAVFLEYVWELVYAVKESNPNKDRVHLDSAQIGRPQLFS